MEKAQNPWPEQPDGIREAFRIAQAPPLPSRSPGAHLVCYCPSPNGWSPVSDTNPNAHLRSPGWCQDVPE